MTPLDIVSVLTAVAPIAASVATMVNGSNDHSSKPEIIVEKETPTVNNNTVNVSIVNNFYTKPDQETIHMATEAQSDLLGKVCTSEKRYDL